ncbi:MAG: alpha/beta hydrolase [Solobacterium sp.]|nr:alpha/beta hydrolase [Solobacterium sp.]
MSYIVKTDFFYPPRGSVRRLHIYLPDGYDDSDERYPVMYFFDGHNLFYDEDATYGRSWGLKTYLDSWWKKMIIVGMECSHTGHERMDEYLPHSAWRQKFTPMGDLTMQWIVNDIKPYIDSNYRTMPFRECTGIGGSSMGGLMSVYAAARYNRWFSKAACLSSSIGFCPSGIMKDLDESEISPDTRVFLSWGTIEARGIIDPEGDDHNSYTYRRNKAVFNKLNRHGALPMLYCQVGGRHCEEDWEKQIPAFMHFLWES